LPEPGAALRLAEPRNQGPISSPTDYLWKEKETAVWIMTHPHHFLLIGPSDADPWQQLLTEVSDDLGNLQTTEEATALALIARHHYDLIVIDAVQVADPYTLVSRIRRQKPEARAVIVTASPTWKRARRAFQAGATDYVSKSMNKKIVLTMLQETLMKSPPPLGIVGC
jgi:CheY-like chemotaxis protein